MTYSLERCSCCTLTDVSVFKGGIALLHQPVEYVLIDELILTLSSDHLVSLLSEPTYDTEDRQLWLLGEHVLD